MIICEIGQNHMGDMELAKQLIYSAKLNGGDLCKFQLYDHNMLYGDKSQIPNVELSKEQAFEVFNYGKEIGIEVFFSVFDIERVKWCEEMGVKRYKVATSQNQNRKLLEAISDTLKEYLISNDSLNLVLPKLPEYGGQAKRLYCIASYPTTFKQLNFRNVAFDKKQSYCYFDGFSDHTIGLDAAKIALARGATIIEKHFCIDNQMGVDAEWSMTPEELRELKKWEGICHGLLPL